MGFLDWGADLMNAKKRQRPTVEGWSAYATTTSFQSIEYELLLFFDFCLYKKSIVGLYMKIL